MPHFTQDLEKANYLEILKSIPNEELVLLDRDIPELPQSPLSIYQNFDKDIFGALENGNDLLSKYNRLVLVFPSDGNYPTEIVRGFRNFCINYHKDFAIKDTCIEEILKAGTAYIVVEENDLAELVKKVRLTGYGLGKEIGIISFNETTLKETNLNTYFSGKKDKLGFTLFSGYNMQKRVDLNNDFLSDLPDETSYLIHPQIFYYPNLGTKIKLGFTSNTSDRLGGDMFVLGNKEDSLHKYFTHAKTNASGADLLFEYKTKQANILSVKGNVNNFTINDTSSSAHFEGVTLNCYTEIYYAIFKGPQTFIIGTNFIYTDFKNQLFDSLNILLLLKDISLHALASYLL